MTERTLWEYIRYRHDEFPRDKYEEMRDVGAELEEGGEPHNEELLKATRHKLAFHDFLDENERAYDDEFDDLFRRYIAEFITENIETSEALHEFDQDTVLPAVQRAVFGIKGTSLERLDEPFAGLVDRVKGAVYDYAPKGIGWEDVQERLARIEEVDSVNEAERMLDDCE